MESTSSGVYKALPLLVVTLAFVAYFINSFANLELNNIRRDWNLRRCEPLVMLIASKVPIDQKIDPDDFSSENFKFCLNKIIDSAISPLFTPIMSIFQKQVGVAGIIQSSTNTLKSSAASLITPFSDIMSSFNGKLTNIVYQIVRSFYKLGSAFDRANAVAYSAVFGGMAMWKGMDNYIRFICSVIVTILIVLVVLVVFLWFVLFPFVPLIISTIGIVSYILGEASTAGMAGAFCVEEGTLVKMKEGSFKKVEEIQPGDALFEGSVEGVLQTIGGFGGKYMTIDGVTLSESHLVFEKEKWIFAKDHSRAKGPERIPRRLFCLNTTTRTWIVKTKEGELLLRDWEELPDDDTTDLDWELLIFEMLNRKTIISPVDWSEPGRGLFGPETLVEVKEKGLVPISEVRIGDYVRDSDRLSSSKLPPFTQGSGLSPFTQVAGIYSDTSSAVPRSGPNKSVWCWLEGKDIWRHPLIHPLTPVSKESLIESSRGYNLITTSGTFLLHNGLLVRDFTEVGWDRIDKTYSFTANLLQNV